MGKLIKILLGDTSSDGHNITQDYIIEVEGTEDLRKDFNEGVKMIGFDIREYCGDYEDNFIKYGDAVFILDKYKEKIDRMNIHKGGTSPNSIELSNEVESIKEGFKENPTADFGDYKDENGRRERMEEGKVVPVGCKTYFLIYMLTCELGNPGLTWREVRLDSIDIGGYGLFSN